MRLALGLAAATACLLAQPAVPPFRHLATTDDGARVYFSSGAEPDTKILVYSGQGTRLFARHDGIALGWPSASGDGRMVAFSGQLPTGAGFQASLALGNGSVFWTSTGQAAFSRNGRFAIFLPDDGTVMIADMLGGGSFSVPVDAQLPLPPGGRVVASDGTAVLRGAQEIQVVRNGSVQKYPAEDTPAAAVIDDLATTVAYETQGQGALGQIILLDLASGVQTVVAGHAAAPRLTNDGQLLLYVANDANGVSQAWIVQRDGTNARQLTTDSSGVAEAVISGDASTAYALTSSMRVLRIDVASGKVNDLTSAITAAPEAPRIISFTGAGRQLCYNVQNAASISIQPGPGAVAAPSGCVAVNPASTTIYTLAATGSGESPTATATVTLIVGSVQIVSFSNDPPYSGASGSAVTLIWTTQNAASVIITGLGVPAGALPVNGSIQVHPVTNTTYTLTAYGSNGQAVTSVLYVFVR